MTDDKGNKLLIIGFDGASPDLLTRWLDEGELPNLKRIIDSGVYGPLRSVPNMSSPSAWTTFATGKNSGKHGIFCFTERNFASYRYSYVNGAFRRAETFWEMLCGDRTGCVINVPMTFPVQSINGCMIAGLDAPGVDSEGVCHPAGLVSEMVDKNGPYRITPDFATLLRKGAHWGKAADRLLDNMEMRYDHTCYLMDKYDWDLFTVVFGETDLAHHFFWKFLEPGHPACTPEEARLYGDTILNVYRKMDDIAGRLLERNPDVTVMIVSDHGGGLNTRGVELVADWLESLGLLAYEDTSWRSPKRMLGRLKSSLAGWGFKFVNQHFSKSTKTKLARILPAARETADAAVRLGGIDWTRTKAFSDGAQDDIWINLAGRDPLGVVSQDEYDQICDFICSELREAVDSVTGKPIVDAVYRRNDIYTGKYVERAADISLRWNTDAIVNGIKTPSSPDRIEAKKWTWPSDICSGGHSLDGILIGNGPGMARGITLSEAKIMDIAPSVLYHFGMEIPGDFDGKVIDRLFDPTRIGSEPPRYGTAAADAGEEQEEVYSEEDSSVIEQRLRDLGYI